MRRPGDLGEVDVAGDEKAGDHVLDEAGAAGVGEGPCEVTGEAVESLPGGGAEGASGHRWASFRLGKCNSLREEAFLSQLSSPHHWGNSN